MFINLQFVIDHIYGGEYLDSVTWIDEGKTRTHYTIEVNKKINVRVFVCSHTHTHTHTPFLLPTIVGLSVTAIPNN